jgi:DNA replication and repair protein RecF
LVRVSSLQVRDLRNIEHTTLDLGPGLNVLVGRNAQGKTSLLEAVALLARGRSFRTEDVRALVRRGAEALSAEATLQGAARETRLGVRVGEAGRQLFVDGREVRPRDYQGRLEVVVYSTDRLRVVRGPMKERRVFLDRAAGALWPSFRQVARDYERVLAQRNAALEDGGRGLEPWNERFASVGAVLRSRRARYVERLRTFLAARENPAGERYDIVLEGSAAGRPETEERDRLLEQMEQRSRDERRVRHSLVGPHRDDVGLTVDGDEVSVSGSSGQARSVLLALCLAMLDLHRAERGESAVALLDDLDSELDEERATALCHEVVRAGQAVVTTAHPAWARRLADAGRVFEVEQGRVRAA